jgi:hypothetical protein
MRIIVERCGSWSVHYFAALKSLATPDVGVLFTSDSTFGLDMSGAKLPAHLFLNYLRTTLRNVQTIQDAGFACVDVKDTLFRVHGEPYCGRRALLETVDTVFVVMPDNTHCGVAEGWLRF